MKRNKILSIASAAMIAALGLSVGSCSLDLANPNTMSSTGFWKTQSDFEGNVTAEANRFREFYGMALRDMDLRGGIFAVRTLDASTINNQAFVDNNFNAASTGYSNFNGIYRMIAEFNEFIYYANSTDVMSEQAKNYMLGIMYGQRAWAYFLIHKLWGTGPLRLEPQVVLGVTNPNDLYMARATATEMVTQIKADIQASINAFNAAGNYSNASFMAGNVNGCYYWTPMATQMLAGEVYLWTGKVSTGDWTANPADVSAAKQYYQNVVNSGKYQLEPTYADVFDVNNKAENTEVILASQFDLNNATSTNFLNFMWFWSSGTAKNTFWSPYGQDGTTPSTTAQRLGYYFNPETGLKEETTLFTENAFEPQRYQYKNEIWWQYNENDTRRAQFMPAYLITEEEQTNDVQYINNFDPSTRYLAGVFFYKYKGQLNPSNKITMTNDAVWYRLPEAYLGLAEIANYEGDNQTCANYINMIRKRAFGSAWDEAKYGYTPGSFVDNEVALLQEKTREFTLEGKRWWDVRRMTTVKGGSATDHMVFQPQGCVGYGLDASNPYLTGFSDNIKNINPVVTNQPIINPSNAYLVLLPLDASLLGTDPLLEQTPGYN